MFNVKAAAFAENVMEVRFIALLVMPFQTTVGRVVPANVRAGLLPDGTALLSQLLAVLLLLSAPPPSQTFCA